MQRDVFLCHASEDKSAIVRPLADALRRVGISVWLDEVEIGWGDSVVGRLGEGLCTSRYVIVVLSRAFMAKEWPKRELAAVLHDEVRAGQTRLLPIGIGTAAEIDTFLAELPLLRDKSLLFWKGSAQPVAERIRALLAGAGEAQDELPVMHSCGLCRSPFEHGVRVCLGCQGEIVYGITAYERHRARQIGTSCGIVVVVLGWLLFGFSPASSTGADVLQGLASLIVPGFLFCYIAGIGNRWRVTRAMKDEVRTFR